MHYSKPYKYSFGRVSSHYHWMSVVHLRAYEYRLQLLVVFCAIRIYAVWERNWRPFWLVLGLYVINTIIFTVSIGLTNVYEFS